MKVLFLELVPNVGHKWDIKEISDSYARNFLIPKNLAKKVDEAEIQKIKAQEKKKEENRRNLVENRHKVVDSLNLKTITFKAKTWENGKMFGWIGEHDIIEKIEKEFWVKLEKKHIDMTDGHIKKLGKKDIYIKLSSDSMAKITVIVE